MSVLDHIPGFGRNLPVVYSAEGAECGLACLAMVAQYHGHDVDLNGLRQRFSLSMAGASLRSIMEIAERLDLSTRPLRVELEALDKVKLPAIIHWDLNHFVVLAEVGSKTVLIHDPGRGKKRMRLEEFSKHFTGVVLELSPSDDLEAVHARSLVGMASLWTRLDGFWRFAFQILALSLALQVVTFVAPFQMQLIIDEVLASSDQDLLTVVSLGFGALFILSSLIEALRSWTLQLAGTLMSFQMVGNLVRHLLRLPATYFEKRHVGDIMSRIGSIAPIRDFLTQGLLAALIDGVMAIVAAIILFAYSTTLALVVIGLLLVNLAISFAFYPAIRSRMEEQIFASAREQSHVMETVRAATTIKIMGVEAIREGSWRNLYGKVVNTGIQNAKLSIWRDMITRIMISVQTVLIIFLGARMILNNEGFSVGMLIAFLSFRQTFSDRAMSLIGQFIQVKMLGLHLDRLADIIAAEPEVTTSHHTPVAVEGALELQEMSFRYGVSDPLVLENVNLDIVPGEYVAFSGPSGGGKTTLVKILLGLMPPSSGEIMLDGRTATPEMWRSWRSHVGVVAQDDRLLSGTIADNIAFFDPDLDMDRVHEAARKAAIHDEVMRMPMQYLSLIGDMGSSLSGGQRQRVLLARALYRDPKVLFLDEGTANLDPASEEVIADLVARMPITRIVVAHRPALLQRADRVLVVQHGRIEGAGPAKKMVSGTL